MFYTEYINDFQTVTAIDNENDITYESLCGKCYLEKVIGIDNK